MIHSLRAVLSGTRHAVLFVGLLALSCSAPATPPQTQDGVAAPSTSPQYGVPDAVRSALLAADFDVALENIARAEKEKPEQSQWWSYLRGSTLARARRFDAALEVFRELERREPPSEFRSKARFASAEVLRATGKIAEAERIFEEEARRLLSQARQEELAAHYFELADALSKPSSPGDPNVGTFDPARAFVLYGKVLELDVTPSSRERARFAQVRCMEMQSRWKDVIAAIGSYRAEFDPSMKGSLGAGRNVFAARFALGRAHVKANDGVSARREYEDLLAAIDAARAAREPFTSWRGQADADQLAELTRIEAETYFEIPGTYPIDDAARSPLAMAAMQRFLEAFPTHDKVTLARFTLGERLARLGRTEEALKAFEATLTAADPTSTDPAVLERSAALRRDALYRKAKLLEQSERYLDAIAVFQEYVARFPTGPDWTGAQQGIVDAEYLIGSAALQRENFAAAREAWQSFLLRRPLDARSPQLQFDLAELNVTQAIALRAAAEREKREAPTSEINALFQAAVEQFRRVQVKYGKSDLASHALLRIGELEERELGRLEAAVSAYRECTFGASSAAAAQRLRELTEPSLELITERAWRSDETPRVKLRTRNVEKVVLETYALDLEAYFRKHLGHLGVENLDLDLIAADQRIETTLAGYAAYKPLDQNLELPVRGPGVWAVAITAGELRATTLVVSSDIDLVARESWKEALVFAMDSRTGTVAKDVRVLIAGRALDGDPTFIEAKTGADGTVLVQLDALDPDHQISVLGQFGAHVATGFGHSTATVAAQTLVPRGAVYTDRPAVRQGDTVNWRALVREPIDGRLGFVPGGDATFTVRDANGQLAHKVTAKLSRFGSVHGSWTLDANAPHGEYVMQIESADNLIASGSFRVEQFQAPRVQLRSETPREVYFRGEVVPVTVTASYVWGEPLVGAAMTVDLADRRIELVTDERGEARYEVPTRDFLGEEALFFRTYLTGEKVSATSSIYLAVREFSASLTLRHPTVLAGSSFDVALSTVGPDGDPVAKTMKLVVLERATNGGSWTESKVDEREMTTDAKGEAHTSLKLTKGGPYLLRASAVDRFGNPVEAETGLFVSGEDDEQRLRFVVASHQLKVGEQATFELVHRGEPGLALVTFEAETMLEHRIVALRRGVNRIELVVDHVHFPNFYASAAFMRRGEFTSDLAHFDVARELVIRLEPEAGLVLPGAETSVRITAVDQLGRPVETEVSLAVVEEGLFELFPDPTIAFARLSSGNKRPALFQTTTTSLFAYQGETRTIAAAVLAEAAREQEVRRQLEERAAGLKDLEQTARAGAPGGAPATVGTGSDDFFLGRGAKEKASEVYDDLGVGGGAGGAYGGRFGGKKNLRARGGAGTEQDGGPKSALADRNLAHWAPSVITDAKGVAVARFRLPEESTRWRVTVRGADANDSFADATTSIVARTEFFVELRAPLELVEGDAPRLLARVHNLTGLTGTAKLTLKVQSGEDVQTYPLEVALGEPSVVEAVFPALAPLKADGALTLELRAEGDLVGTARKGSEAEKISARPFKPTAVATERVDIRPWGVEVADSLSGTLRDEARFTLTLPAARKSTSQHVELTVGPTLDGMLLEAALGHTPMYRWASDSTGGIAAELIGVCAMLELHQKSGRSDSAPYTALRARGQSLAIRLRGLQRKDGAWGFSSAEGVTHGESSAYAMIALGFAQSAGFEVDTRSVQQGLTALQNAYRESSQQADELKALLCWALATHGQADFGALNRLHRQRDSLSTAGLAFTALALARMESAPMAEEVATVLESRSIDTPSPLRERLCVTPVDSNGPWNRSAVEMTALTVLTLRAAKPTSPKIAPGVEYLLSRRPWHEQRARGFAVAAVASTSVDDGRPGTSARITARIGDETRVIELGPDDAARTLVFDGAGRDKLDVHLRTEGRGTPPFVATLRGWSTEFASTDERDFSYQYNAPPTRVNGAEIPTGFDVLQDGRIEWRNEVRELEFGKSARVELSISSTAASQGEADFMVLEIPLPGGVMFTPDSISSSSTQKPELRGNTLILHFAPFHGYARASYTISGIVPGVYRVPPPVLRSALDPERIAIGPVMKLTVLARGEVSRDVYRPTPDETYHLGLHRLETGDVSAGRESLQRLIDEFEPRLKEAALVRVARALLSANIESRASREIVRYFEILREKAPAFYVPFQQILVVGGAYRELGEFERALSIFRAAIDETFGKELRVVGTLEEQKELDRALRVLGRLCAEFPDSAPVLDATLSLSDKLQAFAARASSEPSLSRNGRTRVGLSLERIYGLQRFIALHADDPRAPEAALALVTAHLDLDDYASAAKLGQDFARAFKEPNYVDAFEYSRAVAEWYLGRDDVAMELLKRIASAEWVDAKGVKRASVNRDLAHYILAQIHHTRQDFPGAVGFYALVENKFPDARETLTSLREKRISLAEVTETRPGDKTSIELTHRNIAHAELLVYPVDLMTLYLREKDLSKITSVNLSGIAPAVRKSVELAAKEGMRSAKTKIELAALDAGAYLVICRGDDLHTSGLVLVSGIELDVREGAVPGTLRIQAIERANNRFLRNVDVRVIGSANSDFVMGRTDPRGLFVAEGVAGQTTVIARHGERQYAFHRGSTVLASAPKRQVPGAPPSGAQNYFDNVLDLGEEVQNVRDKNWSNELNRDRSGVQIQQVK